MKQRTIAQILWHQKPDELPKPIPKTPQPIDSAYLWIQLLTQHTLWIHSKVHSSAAVALRVGLIALNLSCSQFIATLHILLLRNIVHHLKVAPDSSNSKIVKWQIICCDTHIIHLTLLDVDDILQGNSRVVEVERCGHRLVLLIVLLVGIVRRWDGRCLCTNWLCGFGGRFREEV